MTNEIVKTCKTHGVLTTQDVYKNKVCKKCQYQWQQKYESKDKEKWVQYRIKKRAIRTLEEFDVTQYEYNLMLEKQSYRCKICHKHESMVDNRRSKIRRLSIDHCHETGQIRGLLCGKCNMAIGLLKHSIETLNSAIIYLTEPKCMQHSLLYIQHQDRL